MPEEIRSLDNRSIGNKGVSILSAYQRRPAILIGAAIFFYWASMYLYVPILPVYAQQLGASLSMVGVIVAAYSLPQMLLRLPIGLWSDSLGRRKAIVIGGVVAVLIGSLGLVFAPSPWYLAASRLAVGIGAAIWVDFSVYFISFYPENDTGKAVGILNFLSSAALAVATLGSGLITEAWGPKLAFLGSIILGFIALIGLLWAPEKKIDKPQSISWEGFKKIASRPLLIAVSIMGILFYFSQFAISWGFISVYAAKIGASPTELGILSMLNIGTAMLVALAVNGIVKRCGYVLTIIGGSIMLSVAVIAVPFVHNVYLLDITQIIFGAGKGILTIVLMSLCIYSIAPQQRATAMGLYQATYAIGMLAGPLISGLVADSYGLATAFYLCGSLTLVIACLAGLRILPRRHA